MFKGKIIQAGVIGADGGLGDVYKRRIQEQKLLPKQNFLRTENRYSFNHSINHCDDTRLFCVKDDNWFMGGREFLRVNSK